MKKLAFILLFIITCLVQVSYAQLENKATAYAFIGVPVFQKAGNIQGQNIYAGYQPIPYLGVGVNYHVNTAFSIGLNVKELYTTKPNYALSNTNLGITAKYNFLPSDKKFSPFISGELNGGYLAISQHANSATEYPVVTDPNHVVYLSQVRNYPEIKTGFSCFGAMIGIGVDFTLKLKYGLFVSANYMVTNASSNFISTTNFADNTSKFNLLIFQAGVKFSFGKKKSIY